MGFLDSTFGQQTDFPDDATIIEITDGEAEIVTSRRSRARRALRRTFTLLGLVAVGAGVLAYLSRRRSNRHVEEIEVETDETASE
jgi:cell division septal protein FtsQ